MTNHFSILNSPFSIDKIVIERALFLGDLLLVTPALRALRQRFPAAEITLIGLPWARAFVARLPYVNVFLEFPGYNGITEVPYQWERTAAFMGQARARNYDLAIQMHGAGAQSNGFVADLGTQWTLGYCEPGDERLTLGLPYNPDEHEVLRWLRLVGTVGAPTDNVRLHCPTTAAEQAQARALLGRVDNGDGPLVALHPGAKDPARRWPAACFAALGDALIEQFGARIVLTGSAGERDITDAICQAMHYPALDLAGRTDLGTFAALIAQLDLLITNDTGASHLAVVARTPSVVLFGPTHAEQWAPLDRARHQVIDAKCFAATRSDQGTALQQLPVEPVLAACSNQIEQMELKMEKHV